MLNKNGVRELAYVVTINDIEPIIGSDNCEAAVVGGWRVMVRKGTFKAGDLAIYFEVDSKVPATEQFAFLEKKHYKVKTQKYTFGGKGCMISQGLLMHPSDFGWKFEPNGVCVDEHDNLVTRPFIIDSDGKGHSVDTESRFLTETLGVVYSVEEDNFRKSKSSDKYKLMAQRHPKIFKKPFIRWMMKYKIGKILLFIIFGKKSDKKKEWPSWVVKTDEERVQNIPWILSDKSEWIATEKIDGTSTTATVHKKKFGKGYNFYICSRNVVFDKPDKQCFYEKNYYTEMAEKYNFQDVLTDYATKHNLEWVTLQGETYGPGVQKRDYSIDHTEFAGFNLITSTDGRLNSLRAAEIMHEYNIPWVPIVDVAFVLPDTVDELINIATDKSEIDGKEREGLVFRSQDGTKSFKAVSNEFLIKYHG